MLVAALGLVFCAILVSLDPYLRVMVVQTVVSLCGLRPRLHQNSVALTMLDSLHPDCTVPILAPDKGLIREQVDLSRQQESR